MMGFYKLTSFEKVKTNILKSYILLYPYWKDNYSKTFQKNEDKAILLANIWFVEQLVIDEENEEFILRGIMLKKKGLEYIAYSDYYSESGLRNKINLILKIIAERLDKINFMNYENRF